MGWYVYPPLPGSLYGPCKNGCGHRDCSDMRREAMAPCRICWQVVGYGGRVYFEKSPLGLPIITHAACVEREAEMLAACEHPPEPSDTTDWPAFEPFVWPQLRCEGIASSDSGYGLLGFNGSIVREGFKLYTTVVLHGDSKQDTASTLAVNPSGRLVLTWLVQNKVHYCHEIPALIIRQQTGGRYWLIRYKGKTIATPRSLKSAKLSAQSLHDGGHF